MSWIKNTKEALLFLPNLLVIVCVLLLILPILLLTLPFSRANSKKRDKEFREYLAKELEGKNFFCYNNRRKGRDCIENDILPKLPANVHVVFLNGKRIESDYQETALSRILYSLDNYRRFPHLFKVRDGKIFDRSINQEFFAVHDQGKDEEYFFRTIDAFFQLDDDNARKIFEEDDELFKRLAR